MLVNLLFASCMSVGGCSAMKASSVNVCLLSVCIVSIGRWFEFSAWIVFQVVLL